MRTRDQLRDGQNIIAQIIKQNKAKLVISGMGSGKTGATLTAIRDLLDRFEVQHVLVIAPMFVAKNTWPDEIAAWEHTRCISYATAVGDPIQRREAVKARKEITTINFENLPWLAKFIGSVENWYWDMVVIDESSRFKGGEGRTKPTKVKKSDGTVVVRPGGNMTRFGIMTTARRKIERIVELTGTPAPQGLMDLWGQAYLLDQGEALGRSKDAFVKQWFDYDKYTYTTTPKANAEPEILDRLKDLLVTIPQEKVCDDPIYIPMKVRLPDDIMKDYRRFEETLYSEPHDVEAVSRGVLANKLLQWASGSLYNEDREALFIHDAKYEALDELVDMANGESLLIFYGFQFDKVQLKRRYSDVVIANEYRGDLVADWNKGRIKKLAAHPASIGHGTNLQFGGHLAAWLSLTWSLELWQQANMRLPRPGQQKQVLIYPIVAENTYDARAYSVLQEKGVTQDRVIQNFLLRS